MFFFLKRKGDALKFLQYSFIRLILMDSMLPRSLRFSRLALHPFPNLCHVHLVGEDDEMFVCSFRDLALNFKALGMSRHMLAAWCTTLVCDHTAFLSKRD